MPALIADIADDQIIVTSAVSAADQPDAPKRSCKSLLDTGSQATMISRKIVDDLGIAFIGRKNILPVSGEIIATEQYRVRLDIPIQATRTMPGGTVRQKDDFRGATLNVLLLPYQPEDYDIILGMDFLAPFHMTVAAGKLIMSG